MALISVLRGLDGGVKVLSRSTWCWRGLLLLFVDRRRRAVAILTGFVTNLGAMCR